jgi:hypothetical protein
MNIDYRNSSSLFPCFSLKVYKGSNPYAGHIIHAIQEEYQIRETGLDRLLCAPLKKAGAVSVDLPFGPQR